MVQFPTLSFCSFDRNQHFEFNVAGFYFDFNDWKLEWRKYIESYNDTYYGKYYRFNSGKYYFGNKISILNSSSAGRIYGLELEIETNNNITSLVSFIHNHKSSPTTLFEKEFFMNVGSYYFTVEREFTQN